MTAGSFRMWPLHSIIVGSPRDMQIEPAAPYSLMALQTSAYEGQASNHPLLRWLKTVTVSDQGEGTARPRQVGTKKTYQSIWRAKGYAQAP